ncbi:MULTISPECIES: hypothetical protein [Streptomyces]|uniref:Uncharacterized protein n=1 Tax=Streptomyces murinus TaxID=33900 RepID=A0A7W3NI47_STRMR|nr:MULTISPECIES: hypothetical protein [Streptomyces]MBA9050973.1 hypothetical protein [Streptomyces murinus]OIJ85164.1 hypothetical protein BIV25_44790 [Streptomyces sp. MUSC 14]TXJ74526.1 hypothetical protein E2C11_26320 [Streptomyces lavendulae]
MLTDAEYRAELDYLIRYTEMSPVYFTPLWDAAETVAGQSASEAEVQEAALRLIGDMMDHGIKVGDMSPKDGEGVIPWGLSRSETLERIHSEMQAYEDPLEYVNICWFSAT